MKNKIIYLMGLIMLLTMVSVSATVGVVDDFNNGDGVISESSVNDLGYNYFGDTALNGCSYSSGAMVCSSSAEYKNNISFVAGENVEFDIKCSTGYCTFKLDSNILEMDSGTTNWVINGGTTHTFIPSDYYHFKIAWNGTHAGIYVNDSLIETIIFNMGSNKIYAIYQMDGGASLYLDNLEITTDVPACVENWTQTGTTSCDGLISNYTITYVDDNTCGTTVSLPVDNGTSVSCCVENWTMSQTTCISNQRINYYMDTNVCNTSYVMPANLTISCGGSGGSGSEIPRAAAPESVPVNSNPPNTKGLLVVAGLAVVGYVLYAKGVFGNTKGSRRRK